MLRTTLIGILMIGITAVTGASTWNDAEIRDWVAELDSTGLEEHRRTAIFDELEAFAAGKLIEERTAEAIFALAKYLPESRPFGVDRKTNILGRMITLYPEDPRLVHVLRRLALNQLAAGETYPAHFTLTRLLAQPHADITPELLIRAAGNALAVGDMSSALDWTASLERWEPGAELESRGWAVRLAAAQTLGHHNVALAALDKLTEERLSDDPVIMLAAARTEHAAGRLDVAEPRYRDFINIHTRSPQRAAAMLEHARLLAELLRPVAARRVLRWLIDTYESTAEADLARVLDVVWQPDLSPERRAAAFRDVAMQARGEGAAVEACNHLLELLIAEGRPLEAVSTLVWMTSNARGFTAIAARRSLMTGGEAAIRLLASREDVVGIAAVGGAILSVGLPLPAGQEATVAAARRTLGLSVDEPRLEVARNLATDARWDEVNRMLAHVDREGLDDPANVVATALAAEALWRLGQDDAARTTIVRTLEDRELEPALQRRLLVLRADIDFARGHHTSACADYRTASAVRESPYVTAQLVYCDPETQILAKAAP